MTTPTVQDFEPKIIVAGETLLWKKRFAEYLPADGWTLDYYFRSQTSGTGFNVTATNSDGDDYFDVTVAAAVTATMAAGAYNWQAWISKDGEKHILDRGTSEVEAGFAVTETSDSVDLRSNAKKILDAIDAILIDPKLLAQKQYSIGGVGTSRMLEWTSKADLLAIRTHYAQLYNRELCSEKIREGAPYFKNVLTRFK